MPRAPLPILVCTHHKTGTVWMLRIFQALQSRPELGYNLIQLRNVGAAAPEEGCTPVYLDPYSRYKESVVLADRFVGMHVIRDPRDVIISGAYYHQKSSEEWLHVPREDCGGLTYHNAVNGLEPGELFIFEMDRKGGDTVRDMISWNYSDCRFRNVKYEDLLADSDLAGFRENLSFLGFDDRANAHLLRRARSVSLHTNEQNARTEHVRSGAARQWKTEFNRRDGERFLELFGSTLIELEYEEDDAWIEALRA